MRSEPRAQATVARRVCAAGWSAQRQANVHKLAKAAA
jgi:hypothetical protein